MSEIVLVVVAHSDDESIAMAGTIRKHVKKGNKVIVVSMTDGVGSRNNVDRSEINDRKHAADTASKILGFEWGDCYDFSDNAMDSYPLLEVVKAVEKVKHKYKPTLVYTHSSADLNVDHRVVANAVLTAFRPQPDEICKELRLFEVASATDYGSSAITGSFSPNLFVDISSEWSTKVDSLNAYASEMREYPHSRSIQGIKNLAHLRGNQVGYDFAEAFEVIRKLED
ncbi:PIG-L deacetylase family protein [Vibrio ostreicida]|uniref:PIG-L deacetylase family protein n=1 Tax=Vibrio ostreicida TaxID=526588 RepID=UPI0009709937|nr:PIG-L deacetylase family protein [Vibrio ostreicida]